MFCFLLSFTFIKPFLTLLISPFHNPHSPLIIYHSLHYYYFPSLVSLFLFLFRSYQHNIFSFSFILYNIVSIWISLWLIPTTYLLLRFLEKMISSWWVLLEITMTITRIINFLFRIATNHLLLHLLYFLVIICSSTHLIKINHTTTIPLCSRSNFIMIIKRCALIYNNFFIFFSLKWILLLLFLIVILCCVLTRVICFALW